MKFTMSWLREHLETDAALDSLAEKLSSIGLEVEAVEDRAAKLAPFLTARVIEASQHPNADRLRVCRVDVGRGSDVIVVCGAPNARTGMAAVFAPPGAFVPGSGLTLKVGAIRGIESAGMLVSARELGLGEDHDGIIELAEGTAPGQAYATYAGLDDPVIEIGVTPNRGDALSIRGIARDLAAAGLGRLKPWQAWAIEGPVSPISWDNRYEAGCPWIRGRHITGVQNAASPEWMIRRLTSIGLRPINALVDVTNFFTFDIGRPLHVFDADLIVGKTLVIRRGVAGETLRALDGKDYAVTDDDVVIADAAGVVSLGGLMGGARTGVSESTRNVFVECGLFDPVHVALSGRRHQLHSDARARFERGVDQSLLPSALDAATDMMVRVCGGMPSAQVSAGGEPAWRRQASLRFARLAELGGADIPASEAVSILERLGFDVQTRWDAGVTVAVPPWRNDIAVGGKPDTGGLVAAERAAVAEAGASEIEPECDLVEEVLRMRGLDTILPVSMPCHVAVPQVTLTPRQARAALTRRVLAARGMSECVTFSFVARAVAAMFGDADESLRVKNPIAADLDQMRPTPLATLGLAAASNAARGHADVSLFEVGPGYSVEGQTSMAVGLRCGATPRHWQVASRPVNVMDAKADVWALLSALGVPMEALTTVAEVPEFYHPGRAATVRQGPRTVVARFGALHPNVQAFVGMNGPVVGFEIFLDAVMEPKRRRKAALELSPFQPLTRDFAFVVPHDLHAETVLRAVRGAERGLMARTGLFDVYMGDGLAPGEKSLGIEVVLQPKDHTLTEAEIDAVCAKVVQAVANLGGRLR